MNETPYAAILYYFPGSSGAFGSLFSGGIDGVPEDMRPRFRTRTTRQNVAGPDGARGLLISWQESVRIEYARDRQTWRKCGAYWIGIDRDYEPSVVAKHDARGNLIAAGWPVVLGDGREYIIPVALADMPNYRIPWRETLSESGAIVRETDPTYVEVCMMAQQLFDHVTDEDAFAMDEDELRQACACAIAVNYRLDLNECLALGMFSYEGYQAIVRAVLDFDSIDELLKKKAAEACSPECGETDA